MSVKIGINPITWTNDDFPELGGDTPLEVCLAETSQAGYRGTELGGKFPRDSKALRAVLSAHGLELVAGWYDGRILERSIEDEFAAILPHLTLLRDCGAKHVVYADTSRGRHDGIFQPISARPKLEQHGVGRLRPQGHRSGRTLRRFRRAHGLSSSHGLDCRDRR